MKLSKELLEKAQTAKSPEELIQMAKTENIDLSAEEAAKAFAKLNASGELSDEELDNVAGGCSPPDPPKYNIGTTYNIIINTKSVGQGMQNLLRALSLKI